jgi:DNA repair photolyase
VSFELVSEDACGRPIVIFLAARTEGLDGPRAKPRLARRGPSGHTAHPFSMRPVLANNPPNPFAESLVEYFEDVAALREQNLQVYEDHTRQILAKNDSPDIGFTYSVNPYRGCFHACAYCLSGETRILMGDGSTKRLADLEVGDEVYGTERRGRHRRYVKTKVLDHWLVTAPAYRVELDSGTVLIASAEHRFLSRRGWKHVARGEVRGEQRPHLTSGARLLGPGDWLGAAAETPDYRRGYLSGASGVVKREGLADFEALARVYRYLLADRVEFKNAAGVRPMRAIMTSARSLMERVEGIVQWPVEPSAEWSRGFLAGIFDAEGSYGRGVLRIHNQDASIIEFVGAALRAHAFEGVVERRTNGMQAVRVRGGLREHLRFFALTNPAITRKRSFEGQAVKSSPPVRVVKVEKLGFVLPLYDITTGTGDFVANGVISHNCYARPTHEYLSFGSGTDFERKIVVKPNAPALLREAFEKRSWKGELIMLSGNTDCYQPLENSYRLTRGILEVCAEYRNPVHIITKSPLIERDVDVLQRLAAEASVGVSISVPFWAEATARALEPFVTTPARRMKTVRRLSEAGIGVTVNIAPLILGLGDRDVPKILEAAAAAGARGASLIPLRLPGSVKEVFSERLRAAFPLSAEKVLKRTREMRGGKLYDSEFGRRMQGEGEFFETVQRMFEATCQRLGLNREVEHFPVREGTFRRPTDKNGQLRLF